MTFAGCSCGGFDRRELHGGCQSCATWTIYHMIRPVCMCVVNIACSPGFWSFVRGCTREIIIVLVVSGKRLPKKPWVVTHSESDCVSLTSWEKRPPPGIQRGVFATHHAGLSIRRIRPRKDSLWAHREVVFATASELLRGMGRYLYFYNGQQPDQAHNVSVAKIALVWKDGLVLHAV